MDNRILVNENVHQQNWALAQAKTEVDSINRKLLPAFESLGIEFDNESFIDCFGDCSGIRKVYFEALDKDLSNTSNQSVRTGFKKDAEDSFASFMKLLGELKPECQHLKFFQVVDGRCTITAEDEAAIRDTARFYACGDEEIEAREKHKKAVEALNNLFKGHIPNDWLQFFKIEVEKDEKFVTNDDVSYSIFVEIQKR